jgi:3-deoxy-7-phosphoheptulonate synthase
VQVALDAIKAASQPHQFLSVSKQGLTAIVRTLGNSSCHVILRGGKQVHNDLMTHSHNSHNNHNNTNNNI